MGDKILNTFKTYRLKANLSQEAVAKALNVAQSAVSQWEQGTTIPRPGKIKALARLFCCSTDDLLVNVASASEGERCKNG